MLALELDETPLEDAKRLAADASTDESTLLRLAERPDVDELLVPLLARARYKVLLAVYANPSVSPDHLLRLGQSTDDNRVLELLASWIHSENLYKAIVRNPSAGARAIGIVTDQTNSRDLLDEIAHHPDWEVRCRVATRRTLRVATAERLTQDKEISIGARRVIQATLKSGGYGH